MTHRGSRRLVTAASALTALVSTVLLSGCSTGPSHGALDGRSFVSTSVTAYDLVAGTRVSLTFSDGRIGADAGCNHLGGSYSLTGDTLTVGTMSTTEMACLPTTKMDQDQWLAALLASQPSYTLSGGTLTLTSGATRIVLTETASPLVPLQGTDWVLTSIVSGTGPSATTQDARLATNPSTLRIDKGQVAFFAGVNLGSGPVTISGSTMTFGALKVTLRPIQNDLRGQVETAVIGVLAGTVTYSIEGDSLTITSGDGSTGLVYRAVTGTAVTQ